MEARVSGGSGSPLASTPATPALWVSHWNGSPAASRMRSVASLTSGPMPSPGMRVAGMDFAAVVAMVMLDAESPELYGSGPPRPLAAGAPGTRAQALDEQPRRDA